MCHSGIQENATMTNRPTVACLPHSLCARWGTGKPLRPSAKDPQAGVMCTFLQWASFLGFFLNLRCCFNVGLPSIRAVRAPGAVPPPSPRPRASKPEPHGWKGLSKGGRSARPPVLPAIVPDRPAPRLRKGLSKRLPRNKRGLGARLHYPLTRHSSWPAPGPPLLSAAHFLAPPNLSPLSLSSSVPLTFPSRTRYPAPHPRLSGPHHTLAHSICQESSHHPLEHPFLGRGGGA